jgi:hopanoid biosynthesis associated protein HpnK
VRRLIVNADDFGLTPGVNRAIIEAHACGVVTSATLMANAAGFEDAVRRTKSSPGLSVGCHVVLLDGTPVSSRSEIPTLSDRADSGQFEKRLISFALRAVGGSIEPTEVETEAAAQIRKLQAAGIQPSHVDTHKHSHMFPQILRPLLRAAKACGVRAVRNPFGRVTFSAVVGRPKLWKRYGEVMLLNPLARNFLQSVKGEGMITPDGSLGIAATGALDERLFRRILENLPEGTWEFVTHPGYQDAELDKVRTRLRQSRETELQILTSEAIRETVKRNGIELISYREFVGERL